MFKILTVILAALFLAACQSTASSNQTRDLETTGVNACVPEQYEELNGDLNFSVNFDCSVNTIVLENLSNNEYYCSIYYSDMKVKSHLTPFESVGFQLLTVEADAAKEYHCDIVKNEMQVHLTKQKMITANGQEIDLQDSLSISCDSDESIGNIACETVKTFETYPIQELSAEQELKEDTI